MTVEAPIVEAAAERHAAGLVRLFEASHCPCFCRYWHFGGTKNEWLERAAHHPEANADELTHALAAADPSASGLVALREGAVVGWLKLTRRAALPKLRALPVYRRLDLGSEDATWSVGCLLVLESARRTGVARALLAAAPGWARAWGASALEGYPRRAAEPLHDAEAWQGPERLFRELGFVAVHDEGPYPVYRMALGGS